MNRVPIGERAAAHDRRKVELLLLSPKTGAFDAFLHDLLDERVARHEANVGHLALAIVVAGDRCVLAPNRMVIARDDVAVVGVSSSIHQRAVLSAAPTWYGSSSSETPSGMVNWL